MFHQHFLRLGVACAVYDDDGRVLLSRRGDMNVWNLPTGRLDSGEPAPDAAAREAREETGIHVGIEHPVGLYYLQATERLNMLFAGYPIGGTLAEETDESTANRFFWLSSMPKNVFGARMAHDAFESGSPVLHIITTPPSEIRRVRRKLARRWVENLLRGRPEPRHVRFQVTAAAALWDEAHTRVLTLPAETGQALPRIRCNGRSAPWTALQSQLQRYTDAAISLRWAGLWQHPATDRIEFVFAATIPPDKGMTPTLHNGAEWTMAQNAALVGRDASYLERIGPTYRQEGVWHLSVADEAPRQLLF